ncbi:hypothetical protein [Herpetosiphon geysericola]|uniref:Uncharacterized protein n=1 Tax=Herpetosiphon geysericola TaxID=70996 RepID=A0A0P6XJJ9_9CHLR|nr:hypothetical protein [Herpetosiphon geysericola]KPL80217.1 hypothetical protein SE18_24485 [Herpetosiphon geysericola]
MSQPLPTITGTVSTLYGAVDHNTLIVTTADDRHTVRDYSKTFAPGMTVTAVLMGFGQVSYWQALEPIDFTPTH